METILYEVGGVIIFLMSLFFGEAAYIDLIMFSSIYPAVSLLVNLSTNNIHLHVV